jgi:hypothetical protein
MYDQRSTILQKNGGLGIPKLEVISASASLKLGLKFQQNTDPMMRTVFEESKLERRLEKTAKAIRIQWPITKMEEIDKYRGIEKKQELKRWARLKSQGIAVPEFSKDKIGNSWLKNSQLLKPSNFITALKMRANVAGNKAALARAKIKDDITCSHCHAQKETLGHILGQCKYTKKARIERHDKIKDYVLDRAVETIEAAVTKVPTLRSPEGDVLKPDLVIKNQVGVSLRGRYHSPWGWGRGISTSGQAQQDRQIRKTTAGPTRKTECSERRGPTHRSRHKGSYSKGNNTRTGKSRNQG